MIKWLKKWLNVDTLTAAVQALDTRGRPVVKALAFALESLILIGEQLIKILVNPALVQGLKLVL